MVDVDTRRGFCESQTVTQAVRVTPCDTQCVSVLTEFQWLNTIRRLMMRRPSDGVVAGSCFPHGISITDLPGSIVDIKR